MCTSQECREFRGSCHDPSSGSGDPKWESSSELGGCDVWAAMSREGRDLCLFCFLLSPRFGDGAWHMGMADLS